MVDLDLQDRVKKARKHARLTQGELAKRVGTSQGAISDLENGRNKTSDSVIDIAIHTGVNILWLARGKGEMTSEELKGDNFSRTTDEQIKLAPVLNYAQAGDFRHYFDDAIVDEYEPYDTQVYGDDCFWIVIEGKSMSPKFESSDKVLINPNIQPKAGNYVIAMRASDNGITFKKYRPRGYDEESKKEYAQLVPYNEDFAVIDSRFTKFSIIGVAVTKMENLI